MDIKIVSCKLRNDWSTAYKIYSQSKKTIYHYVEQKELLLDSIRWMRMRSFIISIFKCSVSLQCRVRHTKGTQYIILILFVSFCCCNPFHCSADVVHRDLMYVYVRASLCTCVHHWVRASILGGNAKETNTFITIQTRVGVYEHARMISMVGVKRNTYSSSFSRMTIAGYIKLILSNRKLSLTLSSS